MMIAMTATVKLVSVPDMISESMSRPSWSAPSKCSAPGVAKRRAMAMSVIG
jgi:hypothetical protein